MYRTVLHYIILYNIALYRTMLYGSVLYYIILYWLIVYYPRRPFQSVERVGTPIDSSILNLLNHPAFLPSLLRRSRQSVERVTHVIRTSPTYGKPYPKQNPSFKNSFTRVPRSCSVSYKTAFRIQLTLNYGAAFHLVRDFHFGTPFHF